MRQAPHITKLDDGQTASELHKVYSSVLSAAKKKAALKELRAEPCLCGCGMKIAECRMKDPQCAHSRGLADVIVKAIRDGRDPQYAVTHSPPVARPTRAPHALPKPVPVPTHAPPSPRPRAA